MSFLKNDLSFFDCNAFIGKHQNPYIDSTFELSALQNAIKTSGINKSLIYHSASVLYDAFYGNELLTKTIKDKSAVADKSNFYPVWIAVPEQCNNKEKPEVFFSSIKKNKISAIKVFPRYHDYTIVNGAIDDLLSFLEEEKIPFLVNQEEILWGEITYILENFKKLSLILQNVGYRMERHIIPFFKKYKNFNLAISRYQAHGGLEYLCRQFSSGRLFFGSGIPIFSPEPIMMMIDKAKISLEEKQNISSKNLLRLLNLD